MNRPLLALSALLLIALPGCGDAPARQAAAGKPSPARPTASAIASEIDRNFNGVKIISSTAGPTWPAAITWPAGITGARIVWHADDPLAVVDNSFQPEEQRIIVGMGALQNFGSVPVVQAVGPGIVDVHILIQRIEKTKWRLKCIASDPDATTVIASWYADVIADRPDVIDLAVRGMQSWFAPADWTTYATTFLRKTRQPSALNGLVNTYEDAYRAGTADPVTWSATFGQACESSSGASAYAAAYNALLLRFMTTGSYDAALAARLSGPPIAAGAWTESAFTDLVVDPVKAAIRSHQPTPPKDATANRINAAIHVRPGPFILLAPTGSLLSFSTSYAVITTPGSYLSTWPAADLAHLPRATYEVHIVAKNTSANAITLDGLACTTLDGTPIAARISQDRVLDAGGNIVLPPGGSLAFDISVPAPLRRAVDQAVGIGSLIGVPTAVDGLGKPTSTATAALQCGPMQRIPYSSYS